MSTKSIPEPWAKRMRQRGLTQGDGTPNLSALARESGLAVETVRRAVHGRGDPSPDTVRNLVLVLGRDVQEWLGRYVDDGPWIPPQESTFLSKDQRDALDQLVRVMAAQPSPVRVDPSLDARHATVGADSGVQVHGYAGSGKTAHFVRHAIELRNRLVHDKAATHFTETDEIVLELIENNPGELADALPDGVLEELQLTIAARRVPGRTPGQQQVDAMAGAGEHSQDPGGIEPS